MDYFLTPLLIVFLASFCMLLVVWWISVKLDFFSLIDPFWSLGFSLIALFYFISSGEISFKKTVMLVMVIAWSSRLSLHLFSRLKKDYPTEDSRYLTLREKWKRNLLFRFFVFFQLQGFSVILLSFPFLIVFFDRDQSFGKIELIGFCLWFFGWVGESVADYQLRKFRRDRSNHHRPCDVGLWAYSRHPNYFFEGIIWCGFALFATSSSYGWISWLSPFLIFYLIIFVTGIPMSEKQSLKSKGALYRDYQKRTSVLIPWFPKRAS